MTSVLLEDYTLTMMFLINHIIIRLALLGKVINRVKTGLSIDISVRMLLWLHREYTDFNLLSINFDVSCNLFLCKVRGNAFLSLHTPPLNSPGLFHWGIWVLTANLSRPLPAAAGFTQALHCVLLRFFFMVLITI